MTDGRHLGDPRVAGGRASPDRDRGGGVLPEGTSAQSEHLTSRGPLHEAELEAIFSAHADAMVIYDRDGEIRAMNPAAREMFGVGEEPVAGYRELTRTLAPLDAHGEPLDLDALPSRRAMRGERVTGFVMAVHTLRGRVWYSASAAPLWAADGAIAGAVLSCVDITHLRRLQEEREQLSRALTHDARTRLNVIRTHAELLGSTEVREDAVRRRARTIDTSACQLADLIDALVDGR